MRQLKRTLIVLSLCSLVGLVSACGDEGGTDTPGGPADCTSGAFGDCVMADGKSGLRRCGDGNWGACSLTLCKTVGENVACTTSCASPGMQTCDANNQWGLCTAAEICDGIDNDCNTQVDENLTRLCYCGLAEGNETCNQGEWSPCTAGNENTPEICDGKDNDCDGFIDKDVTQICYCGNTEGTETCIGADQWGPCSAGTGNNDEICNGIDDDCDGSVDEDLGEQSCGVGACNTSMAACVQGQMPVCTPLAPQVEECGDQIDNDCNGQIDETCACEPGKMEECGTNVGECTVGTWTCQGDGSWGDCSGASSTAEVCDGKDNDCNGSVDDGNPGGGAECGSDTGGCTKGVATCAGGEIVCQGGQQGTAEVCNGEDDDCSGVVDDNLDQDQHEANDSCGTARDLGKVQENAGALPFAATLYKDGGVDSDWYKITTDELEDILPPCTLWPPDDVCYVLEITLQSPAGVNLDFCAYLEECGGQEFCADDEGSGGGDQVLIVWAGLWGDLVGVLSDDRAFYVEVKPNSGTVNSCEPYSLKFDFYDAGCPPCPW